MDNKLSIAIEISDPTLSGQLKETLEGMKDTAVKIWFDSIGEKGPQATKITPDIIFVTDDPGSRTIFKRLQKFQEHYPQASLFVISPNQHPQHIVEVMKSGATEYLVEPINTKVLENAVEEVRVKLASSGKISKGSIYSFISSKGGLGATVIAVNMASALAKSGFESVSLCDMSFQSGDSSVLLDIIAENSFADICKNFHRFDIAFLRGCLKKHKSGIEFLAAPLNPEDCEDISTEHVSRTLHLLAKLFDDIVVDCTSMFIDDSTVEAFHMSKKVFIITDLSVPAIRNAARLYNSLRKLGVSPDNLEFVVNRYIKGGTLSLEEIEKTLGKRLYWIFPNDFSDIVSSINRGIPLVTLKPDAPFAKSIFEFACKLKSSHAEEHYRGIRGAFGKAI